MLSFSAYRMGTDNEDIDYSEISRNSRKEAIQWQTHLVKDIVEDPHVSKSVWR